MIEELYKTIGRRDIELFWLKKNLDLSSQEKLILIEKDNPDISVTRQSQLLDISRSSVYYQPRINPEEFSD